MAQEIVENDPEMGVLVVRMTMEMKGRLTRLARSNGISKSQIVKTAVDDYLRARKIE